MPMKILDLLDALEEAIPDMRDQLGGGEDPLPDDGGLPPLPDEGSPEEEAAESPDEEAAEMDGAPDDLDAMPPMMKKKKPPFLPA